MPHYSKEVLKHFLHPKHFGSFPDADGIGDTKNLRCGDIMKIYIKVGLRNKQEYIKDIRFETMGCGTAIAASDMICELAKGKTLQEAKKINFQDVANKLEPVPLPKIHCAHLAETALKEAIKEYEKSKK